MIIYNIIFIDTLTILLFLYMRIESIKWYWKERTKFVHYPDAIYYKLKNYLPIRSLITYTSSGTYLSFYSSIYSYIYYTPPPSYILSLTWTTLFTTTIGYYIFVFPSFKTTKNPDNLKLDLLNHGPLLLLSSIKNLYFDNVFKLSEIFYPLLFGYFWFFFIWGSWYLTTGDYLYSKLSNLYSMKEKIITILKMNFLGFIGFLTAYLYY